jgi:hypothetical protein
MQLLSESFPIHLLLLCPGLLKLPRPMSSWVGWLVIMSRIAHSDG